MLNFNYFNNNTTNLTILFLLLPLIIYINFVLNMICNMFLIIILLVTNMITISCISFTKPNNININNNINKDNNKDNTDCIDKYPNCPIWSTNGECDINIGWMLMNCPVSCNTCNIRDPNIR